MAHLGDFVGQLVSEIAMARVQADLEVLRVAERYARDPLLKHLPVPRFRMPTVTLRVPVAVADTPAQPEGVAPRGGLDPAVLLPAAIEAMDAETRQLKVARSARGAIVPELEAYVARLTRSPELMPGATSLAETMAAIIVGGLRASQPDGEERLSQIADTIRERLTEQFVALRVAPPRLSMLATAAELRTATNVLTMDLTLTEEAVEWNVVDTPEGPSNRLVIE